MASQPAADGHCAEKPKAIISGQSQAEGMAKFACRVTYQDLTPERRERLKVSILDSLACAIVAIGAPPTAACLAQAKEFGGLNGRCTLIGGGTANVVYATSYNTALVRYIDFMDSFLAGRELCSSVRQHRSGAWRLRARRTIRQRVLDRTSGCLPSTVDADRLRAVHGARL